MQHPLQACVARLRRSVRQWITVRGVSLVLLATLALALVLGWIDFLVRFEDPGLRILCTLAVVALAGWSAYQFLWRPLSVPLSDLLLALRIERRYPRLSGELTSSLEFLNEREDDITAGSLSLRRAQIATTTSLAERVDVREVIDRQLPLKLAGSAGGLLLLCALLLLWQPGLMRIGATRLINPLSATAWPQRYHLAFANEVRQVPQGQPLELKIVDVAGLTLPEELHVEVRYQDPLQEEREILLPTGKEVDFRIESVTRPLEYRVSGGDDNSMGWVSLSVVEPPQTADVAVQLYPPAYTTWPAVASDKHIRALIGTHVGISGQASKKIRQATLCLESGTRLAGEVAADGLAFNFPAEGPDALVIQDSGSYWIELTDTDGFVTPDPPHYEIRAVSDLAPTALLESPQGNLFVTADATVPLVVNAKDDLALQKVVLKYIRSDRSDAGEQEIVLYEVPAPTMSTDGLASAAGESRQIKHDWSLAELQLPPQSQVMFYAAATDFLPQEGISQPQRLTIISREQLYERLAQRQAFILGELARVLGIQRDAHTQLGDVQIQWKEVAKLNKTDIDRLQSTELLQREVVRNLTSPTEGVRRHVEQLLTDLQSNQIDSPEMQRQMQAVASAINRLEAEVLPPIQHELTSSVKNALAVTGEDAADAPATTLTELTSNLTAAGDGQQQVIATLEELLGDLSEFDSYRRYFRDLGALLQEQDDLQNETAKVAAGTLSRSLNNLTPQQKADLEKLAQRQQELARQLDKIQQGMGQMSEKLDEQDPLPADVLKDALDHARRAAISTKMRETADRLQGNQVAQATGAQKQVSEELREMLDILANRRENELERLVEKLREAENELANLREKQAGLKKKFDEAQAEADPEKRKQQLERLSREQKQLQDEAERMARRLKRLEAEKAGSSTASSSQKMQQAGSNAGQGQGGQAAQQAEQAEKDLEQAQQELAQRRAQAEADLAAEQLAKMEDALRGLRDQQQSVIEETARLEAIRELAGSWTRGQLISVGDLARRQEQLQAEAEAMAEKLDPARVFHLALTGAAADMKNAAELLGQQQTGAPTQLAEKHALNRLEQLLQALSKDAPQQPDNQQQPPGGGEGGPQQPQPQTDGIPPIAQLKLLKMLQLEINERTTALDAKRNTLTPREADEWVRLSAEQGRLADLVLELSKPSEENPAEDPGQLPPLDLQDLPELKDLQKELDLENLPELIPPGTGPSNNDSSNNTKPANQDSPEKPSP